MRKSSSANEAQIDNDASLRMVSEGGPDLPRHIRAREPLIVHVPTLLSRLHEAGLLPSSKDDSDAAIGGNRNSAKYLP